MLYNNNSHALITFRYTGKGLESLVMDHDQLETHAL